MDEPSTPFSEHLAHSFTWKVLLSSCCVLGLVLGLAGNSGLLPALTVPTGLVLALTLPTGLLPALTLPTDLGMALNKRGPTQI